MNPLVILKTKKKNAEKIKLWYVSPFSQATKALRESRGIAVLCF
jgi:hypothetical protein